MNSIREFLPINWKVKVYFFLEHKKLTKLQKKKKDEPIPNKKEMESTQDSSNTPFSQRKVQKILWCI